MQKKAARLCCAILLMAVAIAASMGLMSAVFAAQSLRTPDIQAAEAPTEAPLMLVRVLFCTDGEISEITIQDEGLQQLHDALAAYGVSGVVPSWVPEGAVVSEYNFGDEFAGTVSFYAYFSLPDGTGFSMDFTIFAEPSAMEGSWIVKDERPVSYFTLGDVGYYQYTNNASTGICWLNGCVSGLVCGKVPAEVIRSIVYSIH